MIYIVEDDPDISELELISLKNSGISAVAFNNGTAFLEALKNDSPELVVLDIMLPDYDGYELLKRVRKQGNCPVIIVTAKSTEIDRLKGFDGGVDDYIIKPFSILEFVARVRAVLRRIKHESSEIITCGQIHLDAGMREVFVNDIKVQDLTFKEFELLMHLMRSPNRVFSRDHLMDSVWGRDFVGESRTIDIHINTLRKKLGEYGKKIQTVRNVGYKIVI
jgi:two-component system alkaline phosphatase synthesis response regulator PhoP